MRVSYPLSEQRNIKENPMKSCLAWLSVLILLASTAFFSGCRDSKTFYVRPDGGSTLQCTGLVDGPYPGTGWLQDCAWDHPFRALPPMESPRILGGDTLVIASGSYTMGLGSPGADDCSIHWPEACVMAPVPGGPDPEHPTRILGAGWDSGCEDPPELWGIERARMILNLEDASNVEVACLELTDHSDCVYAHGHTWGGTELTCSNESYPYGDWAGGGIYAEDSSGVILRDLDIHGLAEYGVRAGRLADWEIVDVRIATNGWVGWDGDIYGDDSNSGKMTFQRVTIEWNGCAETYPGGEPTGCWGQTAGGYGDGLGTGPTGGDWFFHDCRIAHNTSDGLDLLYHELGGMVDIQDSWFEGNAGNQVKVSGSTWIWNSVLAGNCAFFENQPFTYHVDPCRALGNTLEWNFGPGDYIYLITSTFYGEGDGLVSVGSEPGVCNGDEFIYSMGSLFLGGDDFHSPGDIPFLFYQETCDDPYFYFYAESSLAHNVKNRQWPWVWPDFPSDMNLWADPLLEGPLSGPALGLEPLAGSPVIDPNLYPPYDMTCPPFDILGNHRGVDGDGDGRGYCDIGAFEFQP